MKPECHQLVSFQFIPSIDSQYCYNSMLTQNMRPNFAMFHYRTKDKCYDTLLMPVGEISPHAQFVRDLDAA